ncbi:MAG TPA: DNA glycosylase [Chthonomonadaceae bacterium]|nr:DNA glycosylase [Chthonomonadaceae bacterium]
MNVLDYSPQLLSRAPDSPLTFLNWNHLACVGRPFNLAATLASGQSFRWRQDAAGIWWGVVERIGMAVWQEEGQPDSPLYWQTFPEPNREDVVADYFRLDVDLEGLYADWTRREPRITDALAAFRGLRILRQPPLECFFGFLCATCNTVIKIERSVRRLAERYGEEIALTGLPFSLSAFPTIAALADADEDALRADLWGYRAPLVLRLARHLQTLPPDWLPSLRQASYAEAHAELSTLHGIGAKLADCICLFALDKDAAVPIDTHIRKIGARLFLPELADKSLTPRNYAAFADAYRDRFGPYAGWAQQYLFFAELRRIPPRGSAYPQPLSRRGERDQFSISPLPSDEGNPR